MNSIAIVGLLFGDEGKGTITDYLTRRYGYRTIVRYNGGNQAAHTVVSPDGTWHTFSQFGSGMFVPGTRTCLSRFMHLSPRNLLVEANVLAAKGVGDALRRLWVDGDAPLVTSYHRDLGRFRERKRGDKRHGTTGQGVGEAVRFAAISPKDALRAWHLFHPISFARHLRTYRAWAIDQADQLHGGPVASYDRAFLDELRDPRRFQTESDMAELCVKSGMRCMRDEREWHELLGGEPILFEGAQGVLLDPERGFPPHVTKTRTTTKNVETLAREWQLARPIDTLGVMRAYATRHGAGPFPGEDAALDLPETHNIDNPWQGPMRVGWHHRELLRRSMQAIGTLDGLAVTCLDRLDGRAEVRIDPDLALPGWTSSPKPGDPIPPTMTRFLDALAQSLGGGLPIRHLSTGPTWEDKITL